MISAKFDHSGGQAFRADCFDVEHYKIDFAQRTMFNRILIDREMTCFQDKAWIVANQIANQRGSQTFVGMRKTEDYVDDFSYGQTPAVRAQQFECLLDQGRIGNEIAMRYHHRAL